MRSTRTVRRGPAALFLSLVTLAMSACGGDSPTGSSVPEETAPAPMTADPANRPFFGGAYLGDALSTPEHIAGAIRDFGKLTGKQPALVKTFHDLSCDFSATGW